MLPFVIILLLFYSQRVTAHHQGYAHRFGDKVTQNHENNPSKSKIILGLMVKCTPERGHNALFFIPLEVIIML